MGNEIMMQGSKGDLEFMLNQIIMLNNFDAELRKITRTNEDIVTTIVSDNLIHILFNMMGLNNSPDRLDEAYSLVYDETNKNNNRIVFRKLMNLMLE